MTEYKNGAEVWVKAQVPMDGPASTTFLGQVYLNVIVFAGDQVRMVPVSDVRPVEAPPWPDCPDHQESQHRDDEPPWCNTCGWHRGRTTPPKQVLKPRACEGRSTNVCVAEGCFGEACRRA